MSLSVCGSVENNSVRYNAPEKELVDIFGTLKTQTLSHFTGK